MKTRLGTPLFARETCRVLNAGLATVLAMLVLAATPTAVMPSDLDMYARATELSEMSLEELINVEITSAAKKPQRLADTAAAAYVITQTDIKRSGLTSIPELLRMVPGVQVAHIDASTWAVSCRGHNDDFANKLLVLIDGRSVYDQTFSGVFWDVQDYMLEDIDRIEIIRGPGASVWGANAVNGIINIVTKNAADTLGVMATQLAGGEERTQTAVRFGGKLSANADYRVYAKQTDHAAFDSILGGSAGDFRQSRGGFRMDWKASDANSLTVSADVYNGDGSRLSVQTTDTTPYQMVVDAPVRMSGGNFLARWTQRSGQNGETALQFYYDRTDRDYTTCTGKRTTFDLDYQSRLDASGRHQLIWGLAARNTTSDFQSTPLAVFPARVSDSILSTFAQDEISLRADRLRLTLGAKLEHNSFTGFEFQPNARLLYTPSPERALWAAVARAARTPSESERDVMFYYGSQDVGMPMHIYVFGNPEFDSERLTSYEVGYRCQAGSRLSYDISTFYNHYDSMRSIEPGEPYLDESEQFMILPFRSMNLAQARTYGAEVSTTRVMNEHWKLTAGLTLQRSRYSRLPGSADEVQGVVVERDSPRSQFSLRSYLDLHNKGQLDTMLYYVGPYSAGSTNPISGSLRLDARLSFRVGRGAELILGGRRLFSKPRLEYAEPTQMVPTMVGPTYYTKLAYSF